MKIKNPAKDFGMMTLRDLKSFAHFWRVKTEPGLAPDEEKRLLAQMLKEVMASPTNKRV